jgi:hypothetical protein
VPHGLSRRCARGQILGRQRRDGAGALAVKASSETPACEHGEDVGGDRDEVVEDADKQRADRPKKVEPKTRKKIRMKKLSPMLMFDSHLMPLPTPESADRVEAPMITTSATMIPMVDELTEPSAAWSAASRPRRSARGRRRIAPPRSPASARRPARWPPRRRYRPHGRSDPTSDCAEDRRQRRPDGQRQVPAIAEEASASPTMA